MDAYEWRPNENDVIEAVVNKLLICGFTIKSTCKWRKLDRQTLAYICQYLDLLKQYPMLDDECNTIVSRIINLEEEQKKVTSAKSEKYESLTSLYGELTQIFQGNKEEKIVNTKVDIPNLRRFKVALSFPGEHRYLVEEIAEKLVEIDIIERSLHAPSLIRIFRNCIATILI